MVRDCGRRFGSGTARGAAPRRAAPASILSLALTLGDVVVSGFAERLAGVPDAVRRATRGGGLRGWIAEIYVILRGLGRSRVFTLQAVLTVVLGTVGVGAVYPVLHRVVLRALPYDEPGRLVTVRTSLDQQLLGVTVPELSILSRQTDFAAGRPFRVAPKMGAW